MQFRAKVIATTSALVLTGSGIAFAAIPDSDDGEIHACRQPVTGNLRVIDAEGGASCHSSEDELVWNQEGPQGPAGPQGPQGEPGPAGEGSKTYVATASLDSEQLSDPEFVNSVSVDWSGSQEFIDDFGNTFPSGVKVVPQGSFFEPGFNPSQTQCLPYHLEYVRLSVDGDSTAANFIVTVNDPNECTVPSHTLKFYYTFTVEES